MVHYLDHQGKGNPLPFRPQEPLAALQDSGPVQEIVHQGVDRDHAAADFEPAMPTAWCAEEQLQLNV